MERLESSASEAVYAWRLENNVLYLLDQKGNVIGEGGITGIGGGGGSGGGSGGGNNASMNATNKSGWISKSVAEDQLNAYQTVYYTCHCTGVEQFRFMQGRMEHLRYISAGDSVVI